MVAYVMGFAIFLPHFLKSSLVASQPHSDNKTALQFLYVCIFVTNKMLS